MKQSEPPKWHAYLSGEFVDANDMVISASNLGFTMGVTVTERLRTYHHQPLFLNQHLDRFANGLKTVGIEISLSSLPEIIHELIRRNKQWISEQDDFEIGIFATPGETVDNKHTTPTLGIQLTPARFLRWAHKYKSGETLVVAETRETSFENWPRSLKCRSRMHYWLAEREARTRQDDSIPLLLNAQGDVAESSRGLVTARFDDCLVAPPPDEVLPSISFAIAQELLADKNFRVERRHIEVEELPTASELLVFSSPYFVLPVSSLLTSQRHDWARKAITYPSRQLSQLLLDGFGKKYEVQLAEQATRFSRRTEPQRQ